MAEGKHTPGRWEALPWEVEAGGTDWNVWGPKASNHVGNPNLEGDYGSEADARLIASAPDLLAERDRLKEINAELLDLLQDARDSLYHANNCASEAPGIKQPCNCGFDALIARIDAAIARATGEA
jgi:hypothetical protein